MLRIPKEYYDVVKLLIINMLGGISSYVLSDSWTGRLINLLILSCIYTFVFFMLQMGKRIEFLLLCIWQYTVMTEAVYRLVRYESTPFETHFIFDALGIMLTIMMLGKVMYVVKRDFVLAALFVLVILGAVSTVLNASSLVDLLGAMKLVFRYMGIYVYCCLNKFKVPVWLKPFCFASFAAFILEVWMEVNVDFRNGLFGYEYTGALFSLLLVVISSRYLERALYGNGRFISFCVCFTAVEICLILMESKAEIIMYGIWTIAVFIVSKGYKVSIQKLVGITGGIVGIGMVWSIFTSRITKFTNLIGSNIFFAMQYRIETIQRTKSNAYNIIASVSVNHFWQKWIGIGMGASLPPRYVRWVLHTGKDAASLFNIPKYSETFKRFAANRYYNFFSSSLNSIRLDLGFAGIAICIIILVLLLFRSFIICQKAGDSLARMIGMIGIWQVISVAFRIINNMFIVQHLPMAVTFFVFGNVYYEYIRCKGVSE